jgi:hypothetical protein
MEATNLSAVNLNTIGDTDKFFNNFFKATINVSPYQNDAIVSYFEQITDNKESALALASAVIYTSKQQQTDPMVVLDEFKKLDPGQLNAYLCMFLNLNRVGTSLLGVNTMPIKNKYIERSIKL